MTIILSFIVLVIVMLAMSVGVLLGRKPIKGSCGGMGALGMKTSCDLCGGNTQKCEEQQQKSLEHTPSKDLAYDASK